MSAFACRNCRRPLHWLDETGWLHGELPQYAHEPITCENAVPVCEFSRCHHADGPDAGCTCRCHQPRIGGTRKAFYSVPDNILGFCQGAQICPTDCDDDCEADCHESHYPHSRRDHQPDQCPSAQRTAP